MDPGLGAEYARAKAEITTLKSQLAEAQVKLKGSEERVKMLLDAKNHWQDRAVSAQDAMEAKKNG